MDRHRVAGLGLSPQLGRVVFDALRFCEPLGARLLLDERQQGGNCGAHVAAQRHSGPEGAPQLARVDVEVDCRLLGERQAPVVGRVLAGLASAPEHHVGVAHDLQRLGGTQRVQHPGCVAPGFGDGAFAREAGHGHRTEPFEELRQLSGRLRGVHAAAGHYHRPAR